MIAAPAPRNMTREPFQPKFGSPRDRWHYDLLLLQPIFSQTVLRLLLSAEVDRPPVHLAVQHRPQVAVRY